MMGFKKKNWHAPNEKPAEKEARQRIDWSKNVRNRKQA